jgi:hypothetical protein
MKLVVPIITAGGTGTYDSPVSKYSRLGVLARIIFKRTKKHVAKQ